MLQVLRKKNRLACFWSSHRTVYVLDSIRQFGTELNKVTVKCHWRCPMGTTRPSPSCCPASLSSRSRGPASPSRRNRNSSPSCRRTREASSGMSSCCWMHQRCPFLAIFYLPVANPTGPYTMCQVVVTVFFLLETRLIIVCLSAILGCAQSVSILN